ncbi:hypothetical protein HD554DRAFT_1813652 [Boletus coccyginus]|nr:hypothetical protein HD554DRAFT_1813652 [Boletus coccyginus]
MVTSLAAMLSLSRLQPTLARSLHTSVRCTLNIQISPRARCFASTSTTRWAHGAYLSTLATEDLARLDQMSADVMRQRSHLEICVAEAQADVEAGLARGTGGGEGQDASLFEHGSQRRGVDSFGECWRTRNTIETMSKPRGDDDDVDMTLPLPLGPGPLTAPVNRSLMFWTFTKQTFQRERPRLPWSYHDHWHYNGINKTFSRFSHASGQVRRHRQYYLIPRPH